MNGAKVTFENWHVWVQIIAFFVIFSAFCYFTFRTLRMSKEKEKNLASMPLDLDEADASTVATPKDPNN